MKNNGRFNKALIIKRDWKLSMNLVLYATLCKFKADINNASVETRTIIPTNIMQASSTEAKYTIVKD